MKIINWPAILKYHGEDELIYLASETKWNNDADLSAFNYEEDDALIDNNGRVYHLNKSEKGMIHPTSTNDIIPLSQLIKLVQKHAATNGECCIEKIVFKSIAEGIKLVASMSENK